MKKLYPLSSLACILVTANKKVYQHNLFSRCLFVPLFITSLLLSGFIYGQNYSSVIYKNSFDRNTTNYLGHLQNIQNTFLSNILVINNETYLFEFKNTGFLYGCFITKLNSDSSVAYSTYIGYGAGGENQAGGSGLLKCFQVINGEVYLVFNTTSSQFIVTNGSRMGGYLTTYWVKLNSNGDISFASYIGGGLSDSFTDPATLFYNPTGAQAVAVQIVNGEFYIAGVTSEYNFPVTDGSTFRPPARLGSAYFYSNMTFTKIDAGGNIAYAGYIAASRGDLWGDSPLLMQVDSVTKDVYIIGQTDSYTFPTTDGSKTTAVQTQYYNRGFNTFIKLNANGNLAFSCYLGTIVHNDATKILLNVGNGKAYLVTATADSMFVSTDSSKYSGDGTYSDMIALKLDGNTKVFAKYIKGRGLPLCMKPINGGLNIAGYGYDIPAAGGNILTSYVQINDTGKITLSRNLGTVTLRSSPPSPYISWMNNTDNYIYLQLTTTDWPIPQFDTLYKIDPCPSFPAYGSEILNPPTQTNCKGGLPTPLTGKRLQMPAVYTNGIVLAKDTAKKVEANYQWQFTKNLSGPWITIRGAISFNYPPVQDTVNRWFRKVNLSLCNDTIGISNIDSVLVNDNAAPIINAGGGNIRNCPNNEIILGGTPTATGGKPFKKPGLDPYLYDWSTGDTTANPTVKPGGNTTYWVTVTDSAGCKVKTNAIVTTYKADAGPDVNNCGGSPVRIGANTDTSGAQWGLYYSWQPINAIEPGSGVTDRLIMVNPDTATVYSLTFTVSTPFGGSCSTTDSVTVTPIRLPDHFAGYNKIFLRAPAEEYSVLGNGLTSDGSGDTTLTLGKGADLPIIADSTYIKSHKTNFTYVWAPGAYLTKDTGATVIFKPGRDQMPYFNPITYYLNARSGQCNLMDSVTIHEIEIRTGPPHCVGTDPSNEFSGTAWIGEYDRTPNIHEKYTWKQFPDTLATIQSYFDSAYFHQRLNHEHYQVEYPGFDREGLKALSEANNQVTKAEALKFYTGDRMNGFSGSQPDSLVSDSANIMVNGTINAYLLKVTDTLSDVFSYTCIDTSSIGQGCVIGDSTDKEVPKMILRKLHQIPFGYDPWGDAAWGDPAEKPFSLEVNGDPALKDDAFAKSVIKTFKWEKLDLGSNSDILGADNEATVRVSAGKGLWKRSLKYDVRKYLYATTSASSGRCWGPVIGAPEVYPPSKCPKVSNGNGQRQDTLYLIAPDFGTTVSGIPPEYSWNPPDGLDDPTKAKVRVLDTVPRTYTVSVKLTMLWEDAKYYFNLPGGMAWHDTIVSKATSLPVKVNDLTWSKPVINVKDTIAKQPYGATVNIGTTEAFPIYKYLWSTESVSPGGNEWDNYGVSDVNSPNPTVVVVVPKQKYAVKVTDPYGCEASDTVVVTMKLANAGPDKVMCSPTDTIQVGTKDYLGGQATYSWASISSSNPGVSGGPITWAKGSDASMPQPYLTPTADTTILELTVTYPVSASETDIDKDTVMITAKIPPSFNGNDLDTIPACYGVPIQIGHEPLGGTNVTYSWDLTTGIPRQYRNASYAMVTPSQSITTYKLTNNFDNCSKTNNYIVKLTNISFKLTDINYYPNKGPVLLGNTAPLKMESYSWEPANMVSNADIRNPYGLNLSSTDPSDYVLTVDSAGCKATDTITTTPQPPPSAAAGTNPMNPGASRTIGAASNSSNTLWNATWSPNVSAGSLSVISPGSTSLSGQSLKTFSNNKASTIPLNISYGGSVSPPPSTFGYTDVSQDVLSCTVCTQTVFTPTHLGTYKIKATDTTWNLSDSVIITVTGLTLPQLDSSVICIGQSVTIGPDAESNVTYSWSPANGLNNPNIAQPVAQPISTTDYTLTATTNKYGTPQTVTTVVRVTVSNPAFTLTNKIYCPSDGAVNLGNGVPANMAKYNWWPQELVNNSLISNPKGVNLPIDNSTTFTVAVTDSAGCKANATFKITPSVLSFAGSNISMMAGTSTILGSAVNSGTVVWNIISGPNTSTSQFSCISCAKPVFIPTDAGTYVINVSNTTGNCTSTASVTITVYGFALSGTYSPFTICTGDSVQLSGNTALPGVVYSWSPAVGLNNSNIAQPTAKPDITTTYTLTATAANGNTDTKTVTVTVQSSPAAFTLTDKTYCPSAGPVTLGDDAPTGMKYYMWSPSNLVTNSGSRLTSVSNTPTNTPTVFTLQITNTQGCTAKSTLTITPAVFAPVAGADRVSCLGEPINLGSDVYNQETDNWSIISGPNTSNAQLSCTNCATPVFTSKASGTYIISASRNVAGCTNNSIITVNVRNTALSIMSPAVTVCKGDIIKIGTTPVPDVQYFWSPESGLNDANTAQPIASPIATTNYTLTAVDANKCIATANVLVSVKPSQTPPVITIPDINVFTGAKGIKLVPQISPAMGSYDYAWSPNDGSLNNVHTQQPTITYLEKAGAKQYSLLVTDPLNGCFSKTATVTVTATDECPVVLDAPDQTACNNPTFVMQQSNPKVGTGMWAIEYGYGFISITDPYSPTTTVTLGGAGNGVAGGYAILSWTVTNGSCSVSDYVFLQNFPPATTPKIVVQQPSYDSPLGAITVTDPTGEKSYTITGGINESNTTGIFTGLQAGNYKIIDTGYGGCTSSPVSATINPIVFFSKDKGNLHTENNWGRAIDGSGGITPDFTIPANYYKLANRGNVYELSADWSTSGKLIVPSNAELKIANNNLTIGGVTGNGTITGSSNATLNILGNADNNPDTLYFTNGTLLKNLMVNRSNAAPPVVLGSPLDVVGTLSVKDGIINTNNKLTLKSTSIINTAMVDTIGTGAFINGKVTIERFIPGYQRAFRFLTPGLNSDSSIHANWQEGANGSTDNPHPGYGTHITGSVTGANGFDATATGNSSMFTFSNNNAQVWQPVTNTNTDKLKSGTGYNMLIRGSRAIDMSTNTPKPDSTTLRVTGSLTTGTVTFNKNTNPALSSNAGDYNFIGNPYWAPVDWTTLVTSDISNTYWIWDPTMHGTYGRGGYVSYTMNTGSSDDISSAVNQYLQPGQAFFVQTTGNNPSIIFNEKNKAISTANLTATFGTAISKPRISIGLYLANTNNAADATALVFDNSFTKSIGKEDAEKMINPDENLAIDNNKTLLGIDARPLPTGTDSIQLSTTNLLSKSYTLKITTNNLGSYDGSIVLKDKYTNQEYAVNKNGIFSEIPFSLTEDSMSKSATRFILLFNSRKSIPIDTIASIPTDSLSVVLVSNPVTDNIVLNFTAPQAVNVEINLTSSNGQQLINQSLGVKQKGQIVIPVKQYAAGIYFVEVKIGSYSETRKVIKN